MGRGIAQMMLEAGSAVTLFDSNTAQLDAARASISAGLSKRVTKGSMTQAAADGMMEQLRSTAVAADLATCDLVVEAIVENLAIKQSVLKQIEAYLSADAVIVSNTSSLSVTQIAAGLARPAQVAGWHFFNPVPLMKVVEVVAATQTNPDIIARLVAYTRAFGHTPVVCQDTPGFIVNHAGRAFGTEALALVREGVTDFATCDAILREAAGFRMGPFELMDLTALDVSHPVMESIYTQYYQDPRYRPSNLAANRLSAGMLGRKTQQGFYTYDAQGKLAQTLPTIDFVHADTMPTSLWLAPMEAATRAWLAALAQQCGVPLETGTSPSDTALILCAPLGRDVSSEISTHALPAERTLGIDGFIALDSVKRLTLMRCPVTSDNAAALAAAFLAHSGKAVSLIEDSAGFATQRVLAMVVAIGCEIAQQGIASPADIDAAVRLGLGYPSGPLAWGDALQPTRVATVLQNLQICTGDARYRPALWLQRRAQLGLSLLHVQKRGSK